MINNTSEVQLMRAETSIHQMATYAIFTISFTFIIVDRRPCVHIIQLDNDETGTPTACHPRSEEIESCPEVITDPGYQHDMNLTINAPPPSYEEVMRQPGIYPKVQDLKYI